MFAWDILDDKEKEIFVDMFRTGHGVIYNQIRTFWTNTNSKSEKDKYQKLGESLKTCRAIYEKLNDEL